MLTNHREILWHSPKGNFTWHAQDILTSFEIINSRWIFWGQWVKWKQESKQSWAVPLLQSFQGQQRVNLQQWAFTAQCCEDHNAYAPSQWETMLQCNGVSLDGYIHKMIPEQNHNATCRSASQWCPDMKMIYAILALGEITSRFPSQGPVILRYDFFFFCWVEQADEHTAVSSNLKCYDAGDINGTTME